MILPLSFCSLRLAGVGALVEGFGGWTDCADGRSAGYVFTDPDNAIPEDLELELRELTMLLRELANKDSLDFFEGSADEGGSCLLDLET